jgi:UDP-glucose 4-epimerase
VDGVIHLAAVSRCAPAEADPSTAAAVNVGGTRNLLEALQATNPTAWLIFASSRDVYGEPDSLPIPEDHPTRPKGVYGRSKAEGERLLRASGAHARPRITILRLTNLYGNPLDYGERVIPAFIRVARQEQPLELRGPSQLLDFLHVRDAIHGIVLSASQLASSKDGIRVYNLASGKGITLRSLADQILTGTNSTSSLREVPPVSWTSSGFVGDIAQARTELGWEPRVPFAEGLASLIAETPSTGS